MVKNNLFDLFRRKIIFFTRLAWFALAFAFAPPAFFSQIVTGVDKPSGYFPACFNCSKAWTL
ncbi:MAG: hypothetical protein WCJ49_08860 [Deltaproteobacteria bacterium]